MRIIVEGSSTEVMNKILEVLLEHGAAIVSESEDQVKVIVREITLKNES